MGSAASTAPRARRASSRSHQKRQGAHHKLGLAFLTRPQHPTKPNRKTQHLDATGHCCSVVPIFMDQTRTPIVTKKPGCGGHACSVQTARAAIVRAARRAPASSSNKPATLAVLPTLADKLTTFARSPRGFDQIEFAAPGKLPQPLRWPHSAHRCCPPASLKGFPNCKPGYRRASGVSKVSARRLEKSRRSAPDSIRCGQDKP